jgi:hypothetical protein
MRGHVAGGEGAVAGCLATKAKVLCHVQRTGRKCSYREDEGGN